MNMGFSSMHCGGLLDFLQERRTALTLDGFSARLPMCRINPSRRKSSLLWSIKLQGQRICLYLLLEFQSSIDKGMPVRMMQQH
ncbi:Rpn family recombination-promoting nuclease/putative transposase [Propionivibrio sp.]|uniref:Rpn family recombination-promoting nuclease/putative transposase n=1 Tax=Propionivibrio sp. TaxID=2212460 RepID=UPI003BF0444C